MNMNLSWKTLNLIERIALVLSVIILAFFIVTKIFPLNVGVDWFYPCMALAAVLQALLYWRRNRSMSVFAIVIAVIFIAVTVIDIIEPYVQ